MKKGFTLIELLVVIAILGILSSIGIFAFQGYQENARLNVAKVNYKNILSMLTLEAVTCESGMPIARKQWPDGKEKIVTRCSAAFDAGELQKHFIFMSFKNPYFSSPKSGLDKLWDEGIIISGDGDRIGFIYSKDNGWVDDAIPGDRSYLFKMTLPDGEVISSTIELDYHISAE